MLPMVGDAVFLAGFHSTETIVFSSGFPQPTDKANMRICWCIPGGWYHMGMDEVMIGAIIQAVCACAGSESHAKQLRLQRVSLGKHRGTSFSTCRGKAVLWCG